MKFAAACLSFFGKKPGETLNEFAVELRKLTPQDKAEFKPALEAALGQSVEITPEPEATVTPSPTSS
jgi:hypothetical protein